MPTEQGYSNQKKKGQSQFKTIHGVGSDSFGTPSIPKYLSDISLADQAIVSISDVLGKDGQVQYWEIGITAHTAVAGNVLRIVSGSLKNFEFEVISIPDANHLWVLPISSSKPLLTDLAKIMGWVTAKADDQGNPVISQGPVQFKLDNVITEVSKDSIVPANTVALPTENLIAEASLSSIDGKLLAGGVVDSNNSSVTPLGIGAVFTGTAFEVTRYAVINVCVASDVASATDGVKVEFSEDGTNWDHNHKTTYSAATGVGYIFNAEFKYARVVYTNGAVAQAYFRLQTIFKTEPVKQSLYTIAQSVTGGMFAELGKNVIIGETTGGGGGYVPVKVTPSGALTVEAAVTGSVSVSNFPATQPISGSVSVSNFPATQAVTGTFFQATQPVSGSVSVSNFPATQAVTGTFWQATQPVSGSVSVSNFPATQAVTGTFWQATQPISGSVSVSNFPSTQNVAEQTQSGTITQIQKTVGLTAVRATVSGSAPSATRKKLMLKPSKNNTGSIYFGASTVTIASGMEIIGPDRLEFLLDASDFYLISDTAGQVVEIVEIA